MNKKKTDFTTPIFSSQYTPDTKQSTLKIHPENIADEMDAAIAADDYQRALQVWDAAPRSMKKAPLYILLRASLLLSLGQEDESFALMREVEQKHPRVTSVYGVIATLYSDRDFQAHALQSAQRALPLQELPEEDRIMMREIIEEATAYLEDEAERLEVSFETMQRASHTLEEAEIAFANHKLYDVIRYATNALKIIPGWVDPHNIHAQALYYLGRTDEAISIEEKVLENNPENLSALRKLITFHVGLDQTEKAQTYGKRLAQLATDKSMETLNIDYMLHPLALIEDTETLWKIAERCLTVPADDFSSFSWYILMVAAIRSDHWKEALQLAKKIEFADDLSEAQNDLIEELKSVANQTHPRLDWMPPDYSAFGLFFYPKIMTEWDILTSKFDDHLTPSQTRKFEAFFKKYPFLVVALKHLLWEKELHSIAFETLLALNQPEIDQEIIRFVSSKTGSRQTRFNELMALLETERYDGSSTLKIWDEEKDEWLEIAPQGQQIGPVEPNIKPATLDLIMKAEKAKNTEETIRLLDKAIQLEPTSPIPLFNMGVTLSESGQEEEADKYIQRSVAVDPHFYYGHAAIAFAVANTGRKNEALEHLKIIDSAKRIDEGTAVLANLAYYKLDIQNFNFESAQQRLDIVKTIDPQHDLLKIYQDILNDTVDFNQESNFFMDYARQSSERSYKKLLNTPLSPNKELQDCLATHTKEYLVVCAQFLGISSSGKKGEIVAKIAKYLRDADNLETIWEVHLEETEKEALNWLLKKGGIAPWTEFVNQYEDDPNEAGSWRYEEPETVPGRLRLFGLLYSGLIKDQQVAFLPADLRAVLENFCK